MPRNPTSRLSVTLHCLAGLVAGAHVADAIPDGAVVVARLDGGEIRVIASHLGERLAAASLPLPTPLP